MDYEQGNEDRKVDDGYGECDSHWREGERVAELHHCKCTMRSSLWCRSELRSDVGIVTSCVC